MDGRDIGWRMREMWEDMMFNDEMVLVFGFVFSFGFLGRNGVLVVFLGESSF